LAYVSILTKNQSQPTLFTSLYLEILGYKFRPVMAIIRLLWKTWKSKLYFLPFLEVEFRCWCFFVAPDAGRTRPKLVAQNLQIERCKQSWLRLNFLWELIYFNANFSLPVFCSRLNLSRSPWSCPFYNFILLIISLYFRYYSPLLFQFCKLIRSHLTLLHFSFKESSIFFHRFGHYMVSTYPYNW
jgi:hypothetical protein